MRPGFQPIGEEPGPSAEGYSLVEDVSKVHMSGYICRFKLANEITCSDWPGYSPDLNPIKNFWQTLKRRLNIRF